MTGTSKLAVIVEFTLLVLKEIGLRTVCTGVLTTPAGADL